jgi:hypothetical protein
MVNNKSHPVAKAIIELSDVVRERVVELSIEEPSSNIGKVKAKKRWLSR